MLAPPQKSAPPELWGGVECTVNRVGDEYLDQLRASGHHDRIQDLELFAAVGIKKLRYPVLWERVAPGRLEDADWSWTDARLSRIRELGIEAIAGLLHHGSGPRCTSLLDPEFPQKFAAYARAVAERYPWLRLYTPVNEPLTTARFSCLYGAWYPHRSDNLSLLRALLNQCRAIVLAMRAIRQVNPRAQLLQTEDLGKVFSTPPLAYQADFENERRWASIDLLCGRLCPGTAMWSFCEWAGIPQRDLAWFQENATPPDLLGFNYYLTSERFLDHRSSLYPSRLVGGNGRDTYVDTEAVRVRAEGLAGPGALLEEAWQRFGRPLALTEVHNGCTREEQMRWFADVWEQVRRQRERGVDVRAVTAWALLGSHDWDSLVTCCAGHYEPGVFDIRAPRPRVTALAKLVGACAAGRPLTAPVLQTPGWWHSPRRLIFGHSYACPSGAPTPIRSATPRQARSAPVLVTGSTGTLGQAFARICDQRGIVRLVTSRADLDIAERASVEAAFDRYRPWAVINCAGYVRVDDAEDEPQRCMRENTDGPTNLASSASRHGIPFVTFSSDLVFDGKQRSYREEDPVSPLSTYGRSKATAERRVFEVCADATIIRTSAFFGPWDRFNFLYVVLLALRSGRTFSADDQSLVSPTYVPDLVHATLDLLLDGETGIVHLANVGEVTWAGFARMAATACGLDPAAVRPASRPQVVPRAPRPRSSVLRSSRFWIMPPLQEAVARFFAESETISMAWQNVA